MSKSEEEVFNSETHYDIGASFWKVFSISASSTSSYSKVSRKTFEAKKSQTNKIEVEAGSTVAVW